MQSGGERRIGLGEAVQTLYPEPGIRPLEGLYPGRELRERAGYGRSCVYANFIASLDGRIAIAEPPAGEPEVPRDTANARDWRLLLELAAPADAVIVSGAHLRRLAEGSSQAPPPFDEHTPEEILAFRQQAGLAPQPALVVTSRSLDLPESVVSAYRHRPLIIATGEQADPVAAERLSRQGARVLRTGRAQVEGASLVAALGALGLRVIYSIAGPTVMQLLLHARVLDRLYLTTVLRLLGGSDYATMTSGARLVPPYDFDLAALYLDRHGPGGIAQLLQVFDRADRSG